MKSSEQKDLGFILLELNNSESQAKLLKTVKKISENLPFNQICLFNSYSEIIDHYQLPILHISQVKFFDGRIVVFDVSSLKIACDCPKVSKILFYAEDLAWQQTSFSYNEWRSICDNSLIEIIAKNQQIYDLYTIIWKQPLGISEDFDYETIKQFI